MILRPNRLRRRWIAVPLTIASLTLAACSDSRPDTDQPPGQTRHEGYAYDPDGRARSDEAYQLLTAFARRSCKMLYRQNATGQASLIETANDNEILYRSSGSRSSVAVEERGNNTDCHEPDNWGLNAVTFGSPQRLKRDYRAYQSLQAGAVGEPDKLELDRGQDAYSLIRASGNTSDMDGVVGFSLTVNNPCVVADISLTTERSFEIAEPQTAADELRRRYQLSAEELKYVKQSIAYGDHLLAGTERLAPVCQA